MLIARIQAFESEISAERARTITVKDTKTMVELEPSWKEKLIYSKQYDIFDTRENTYRLNMGPLYNLIWGQCSKAMQTKLKSMNTFRNIHTNKRCDILLKIIQGIMFHFETKDYLALGLKKAIVNYYACVQRKKETCACFLARFKSNMDVLSHYGGSL